MALHIHIHRATRDAAPKFKVGQAVNSSSAGSWAKGKQIPYAKMTVQSIGEKNGELTYGLIISYTPQIIEQYKTFGLTPTETVWAYESELS